jgi:hypothetical protein
MQQAHLGPGAMLPLAFHPRRMLLAAVSASRCLFICNLSSVAMPQRRDTLSLQLQLDTCEAERRAAPGPALLQQGLHFGAEALAHDRQGRIHAVAWRPATAATVAVGHRHGVCVWRRVDEAWAALQLDPPVVAGLFLSEEIMSSGMHPFACCIDVSVFCSTA